MFEVLELRSIFHFDVDVYACVLNDVDFAEEASHHNPCRSIPCKCHALGLFNNGVECIFNRSACSVFDSEVVEAHVHNAIVSDVVSEDASVNPEVRVIVDAISVLDASCICQRNEALFAAIGLKVHCKSLDK